MAAKDTLGRDGEDTAANYLRDAGYDILDRNWRCPLGEVDIIARDGDEIVVVEVKTRTTERYGHPLEAVDTRKRSRLWKLAAAWCRQHPDLARGRGVRVDAVAIVGASASEFRVEHLQDLR
ncbi:YraN family protein [Microbacterium sp. cx-59]|uniref:YraN family protein n=1 Tax=Microbacterium sp. cx-59 TaxID=2891207 RepID=UPI001E33D4F0|nr:YraN family protein [Microbacterium sp. cx-59]MCC4907127.1 YraN family protein [Microbacterium sp. cx-59]